MAQKLTDIESNIHTFISSVSKDKHILKAYLYGSYAKGLAGQWSDIDLAIISPDFSEDLLEERVELMKLALRVDDRIEPCPFRPEDFIRDNPLVDEISKSGIEIPLEGH